MFNPQRADDRIAIGRQTAHLQTLFNAVAIVSLGHRDGKYEKTKVAHYASFSASGIDGGCRSFAENNKASRTVAVGTCVSIC